MNRFFLRYGFPLIALLAVAGAVSAQQVTQPGAQPGQIPAQSSATNAGSGFVGEYASAKSNGESIAVTVSHATPAVITMTANTFASRCQVASGSPNKCSLPIYFTGLGGAAGLSNSATYWVDPATISGNTFSVATSAANALAGTDVATTNTDSGTGIASAYMATNATTQANAALSLSAGDWDCNAQESFVGVSSTAPTKLGGDISTSTTSMNVHDAISQQLGLTFTTGAQTNSLVLGYGEFLQGSQTIIYMTGIENWTGGATNPTVVGQLRCRRVQ
jgi:hypothetical protein